MFILWLLTIIAVLALSIAVCFFIAIKLGYVVCYIIAMWLMWCLILAAQPFLEGRFKNTNEKPKQ